jgi:hypothetical protein
MLSPSKTQPLHKSGSTCGVKQRTQQTESHCMLLELLFRIQEVFASNLAGRLVIIESVSLWLSSAPPEKSQHI